MPKSSAQVGTRREPLPSLFASDGRHEEHAPDSGRRASEPLVAYEHTFYLGHAIVEELANGVIAPELLQLARDAVRDGRPKTKLAIVRGDIQTIEKGEQ